VMFAVGRNAETTKIGLDKAGVILDKTSGKVCLTGQDSILSVLFAFSIDNFELGVMLA
jgi:hypothetical protein